MPKNIGILDQTGNRIVDLGQPIAANDATTKFYVDALFNNLDVKQSVRVASTAPIAVLTGLFLVDGALLVAGDRVLVKNQVAGADNGIYVAAAGAWVRAEDFNADSEVTGGAVIPVSEGTANGNKSFKLTTDDPIIVGTTALAFADSNPPLPLDVARFERQTFVTVGGVETKTITHLLANANVAVQIKESLAVTGQIVGADINNFTTNTFDIVFPVGTLAAVSYDLFITG